MAWKRVNKMPRFWSVSRKTGRNIVLRGRSGRKSIERWADNHTLDKPYATEKHFDIRKGLYYWQYKTKGGTYRFYD